MRFILKMENDMNTKTNIAIATSKPALVMAEGSTSAHLGIVNLFMLYRYYK